MKLIKVLILIIISNLIGSCNNLHPFSKPLSSTATVVQPGYPPPVNQLTEDNSYPSDPSYDAQIFPNIKIDSDFFTPEPKTGVAIIYGTLKSATNGLALGTMKVYIAEIVPLEPEGGVVYTIQQNSSPQADTDSMGRFTIVDIPEGDYVIFIRTPLVEQIAVDSFGEPIDLNLSAGKVYNLDEIFINWP